MPTSQTVPTILVNGVECAYAMPNGRLALAEGSSETGPAADLVFRTAWAQRWALVAALRGACRLNPDGETFSRGVPFRYPYNPNMVCTATGQFEYVGTGANEAGELEGVLVNIPARFACVPWQFQDGDPAGQNDASGQAWTVTKIRPSAEVYQPTGGSYYLGPFPSTNPLDEASVGFLRANCEITVTRKFFPAMPVDKYDAALGKVSSTAMTFGRKTYGAGFLLLIAGEASEPYFDCLGNPVMDLNFVYLARSAATWNSVQDRAGAWQVVNSKADGTGNPPFASYDFTTLPR